MPIGGGVITGFGDGGVVESAENSMKFWAKQNGCETSPKEEYLPTIKNDGTRVKKFTYSQCKNNVDVVYYIVEGMGHGWPPKKPQAPRRAGPTSQNIDATKVIWEFFKGHSKVVSAPQAPAGKEFPFGLSNPYEDDINVKKALPQILSDLGLSQDENGAGFVVDNVGRKYAEKNCNDKKCESFDFSQAKELIDVVVGEGKANLWVVIVPVTDYKFTDGKKRADGGNFMPEGPVSRQAYKDYLTALVQYMTDYGKKVSGNPDWHVVRWNLFNEVVAEYKANYNKDMEKATRAYADFVIDSAEVLRRLTPQSEIVLAGAGSNTDLMGVDGEYYKMVFSKLKQANVGYDLFDYWESHWFGEAHEYAKNNAGYGVKDFISFLKENGFGDKEFLIRAGGTYSGQDTQERKRLMDNFQSEEQQANHLFKRFIFNAAAGAKKIPWSTVFEHSKYQGSLHVHFNYIGLIYNGVPDGVSKGEPCVKGWLPCRDPGDGVKKLSYYTYKFLIEKLKRSDFADIKTINTGIPNVYLYEFTKEGKPIYVAWWDYFKEPFATTKQVSFSLPSLGSSSAKITEAIPAFNSDFQSSTNKLNEADYPKFFKTYTAPVTDNAISIILSKKPVYIDQFGKV